MKPPALVNTPRKRGRPPSDGGSRKRKQPATTATVTALPQANLANLHPSALASMAQLSNSEVAAFLHAQQTNPHAHVTAGTRATAHVGFTPQTRVIPSDIAAAYTNVITADPGLGYGAGPSVAAMSNPGLVSYDYGQLYNYTADHGDNGSDGVDGTANAGQLAPSNPFVMQVSPMLNAQAQAQAEAQAHTPYLGFVGNSYFSGFDIHPHPNAMGMSSPTSATDQQVRGLGVHASGPFFSANGQMFPAQLPNQAQFVAGNTALQTEPPIQQAAALHANERKLGHRATPANPTPQVVAVPHATQPHVSNTKTHPSAMPLVRQSTATTHVDHGQLSSHTPHIAQASLATPRPATATPRLSPAVPHAPTPRTCAASPTVNPSTPPPPTSIPLLPPTPSPAVASAPTPFASTSSDLSSIPSESPTVTRAELLNDSSAESSHESESSGSTSPEVVPVTAAQPAKKSYVSATVYSTVLAKLNTALQDLEGKKAELDKLVLPSRNPQEDLVASLNKRLVEAEERATTHKANEETLRSTLNQITRGKGKSGARAAKQNTAADMLLAEAERDSLKVTVAAQKDELAKVNYYLQQVMERMSHLEHVKAFHLTQLNDQANEINTLRAELEGAHRKIAQMVAIRGVALEEVSPIHLAPPLERSNSSSVPTTPIYTPTQPLPLDPEAVPAVNAAGLNFLPRSITPIRGNSLPASLVSGDASVFHELTPRACHNTSGSISTVAASVPVEPGSPWKNWLQLDTTPAA